MTVQRMFTMFAVLDSKIRKAARPVFPKIAMCHVYLLLLRSLIAVSIEFVVLVLAVPLHMRDDCKSTL